MEDDAVFDSNIGVDMKTIVYAVIFCGVIATTPFPHPISKFIIRAATILYILMMVWANFTSEADLHKWVEWLDPSINRKIKFEAMTGDEHCALTVENVSQYDVFFLLHIFGWAAKTMMVRDFYVTTAISFMFEVIEESLEHHQPVFFECWWNRWIIDFVLCNGIAIWIGMHICTYLEIERSWWCIGNYKRKKEVSVFSLAGWNVQSLTGYLLSMIVVFSILLAELFGVYLTNLLWFPTVHWLPFIRHVVYFTSSNIAFSTLYEIFNHPEDEAIQNQSRLDIYLSGGLLVLDGILTIRLGWNAFEDVETPVVIKYFWIIFSVAVVVVPFISLYIFPKVKRRVQKKKKM
mmetsp:Transcript_18458/g.30752  ORF Transcript_18458/g.30752 Transcript_18458/m.30752 type:complete len:347 (-) Transcript_18458:64-1104(-)